MPGYFTGDELGAIKTIKYTRTDVSSGWASQEKTLLTGGVVGRGRAVQKLAVRSSDTETLLAAARADGSALALTVGDGAAQVVHEWKETRMKSGQRYVGLAVYERRVYSCTSNGALRITRLEQDLAPLTSALPMRLCDWRLSANSETFAYGGDEVELSVWNTETAFSSRSAPGHTIPSETKKRKRSDQLLPGEIWRAKNLPNDNLSLRQPVHITALTYLQPSPFVSQQHILTGTQHGHVRRYDTRVARRPVADWRDVGKIGGVSAVEKGFVEHEAFVADHGCNLFALDLRNGKVSYGYKGLSGAVSAVAPAPSLLASVAQDRFLRLHSTFPPPAEAGQQQESKGQVLDKLYMKSIPTAVVWDHRQDADMAAASGDGNDGENAGDEDLWEAMEDVESGDEEREGKQKRSKNARAV